MELLITTLAGLSIALGFLIVRFSGNPHRIAHMSVALAFGAMVALACFDLVPEALEISEEYGVVPVVIAVIAGLVVLWGLDRILPEHGHGHSHGHGGSHEHGHTFDPDHAIHIGLMATVVIVVHNILEGMTVYAISVDSLAQGASYAFGIMLHNLPIGMLIFSTLAEEEHRTKVIAIVGALFSTMLGGIIMMLGGANAPEIVRELVECAALGMVAYIALAELLPQIVRDIRSGITAAGEGTSSHAVVSIICIVVGFVLVYVASLFA